MFLHKIQMVAVGLGLVLAAGLGVGGLVRGQSHDPAPPPLGGAVAVVERPLPPPDPVAILREKLVGRWQVDAGTRNGQPLTAWETRGYQIDFDERDLRIQRGTIRDLRTFAWTIEPAAEPSTVILTPPDGNAATAVRMTVELKDEALTLSWDESATPPRGRIPSSTSRLTLSRSVPDGSAQAGLTVAPAAENVVGSRLAGEWEPDPELAKRLGPAAAKARLTITADPAVAREIPVAYRPMLADKRIYLAGRMRVIEATDATYPFLLVEHLGNPLLVYFLPIGPDVCAAEEAATVMLVRAADRKDDLLVVTAFDTAKHAPAGGYRRVPIPNTKD